MRFDLVTIFPEMLLSPLRQGVIGQASASGLLDLRVHDLRDFADPPRRRVDDESYGGGSGMVFRPEPLRRAVSSLRQPGLRVAVILPSPAGERLGQSLVRELAGYEQVVVLCDRYEGADARTSDLVTHEISLGDFVLTGGEIVALAIVDSVARQIPGVVGKEDSVANDSFASRLLDHRHYTRPPVDDGKAIPAVLASGDHAAVAEWRQRDATRRTLERRPDLLYGLSLSACESECMVTERRAGARSSVATRVPATDSIESTWRI